MKNWIVQIAVILLVSTIAAVTLNAVRDNGIAMIGNWPSRTASGEGPITPPSAEEGDPLFITLDDAVAKYQAPDVIFIDSRDPADYEYARITRSINIPFDYLDETWDAYIADSLDPNAEYVIYCSGDECELSLFLGRYLQELGFEHIYIFYGGWREWEENDLPITMAAQG